MKRVWSAAAVAVVAGGVTAVASPAWATNGYFAHGHGTPAKGRAGAGTAYGFGPLAAATNPALGEGAGNIAGACLTGFYPDRDASISGTNPLAGGPPAGDYKSENDAFYILCGGANMRLDDRSTLGVLMTANGGMNTEYEQGMFNPTRQPTGVDLGQMFVGVNYARDVGSGVTLGIMPMAAYQMFEAKGLQGFASQSSDPSKLSNNGADTSMGGGLKLGALWDVTDRVTLGASYQSRLYMNEFDDYAGLFAEQGDFDIPAQSRVGVAVEATPALTLIADWERIEYSQVAALGNSGNNCGPLGADNGCGFGWNDMDIWRLGAEWKVRPGLVLRAGVSRASDFTDGSEATLNVLAPATIKDHASVGFSYRINESWGMSGSYTRSFSNTLNGTVPAGAPPGGLGGGNVDLTMDQHELSFGVSYRW